MSNPMDISKGRIQGRQQLQKFTEVTDRLKVGLTALWDLSHRLWTWTLILSPCHQGHCHVVQIHTNIWCVRVAVHYLLLLCCVSATAVPLWVIVSNGLTGRVHWGPGWHQGGFLSGWPPGRQCSLGLALWKDVNHLILPSSSPLQCLPHYLCLLHSFRNRHWAQGGCLRRWDFCEIFAALIDDPFYNTFSVMSPFLALDSPPAASVNPFERMASLFQDIQKLNGHDQGTHILCCWLPCTFTFILCLFWDNNSISWYYTSVITLKTWIFWT